MNKNKVLWSTFPPTSVKTENIAIFASYLKKDIMIEFVFFYKSKSLHSIYTEIIAQ